MNGGIIGASNNRRSGVWSPIDTLMDTNGIRSANADITSGLIHKYPLTSDANDVVGTAHLTNNNSVAFSSEGAAFVRGSSKSLTVTMTQPTQFSWSLWFKVPAPGAGENHCICGIATAVADYRIFAEIVPTYSLTVDPQNTSTINRPLVNTGGWRHLVIEGYAVGDNPNEFNAYVDGTLLISSVYDRTGVTITNTLALGRPGAYNGDYLTGNIRDFRIYERHLTAAEVLTLYRRG
jgi:hypothetical protein